MVRVLPVRGLRPSRAARLRVSKFPKPLMSTFPPRRSFYDLLAAQLGGGSNESESWRLATLLGLSERRAIGIASAPVRLFRAGEPLALMPYGVLR